MIDEMLAMFDDPSLQEISWTVHTKSPHTVLKQGRTAYRQAVRLDLMLHMDSTKNGVVVMTVSRSV